MPEFDGFLKDLALVLITAAVVAVVFQRLRLPTVLGYLIAGLLVGPHVPFPLFADIESTRALAELGITLLMFSIGLEFSVRKLIDIGRSSLLVAAIEVALLFWLGFLVGAAFGWSASESACLGAMAAIASTMVVAKMLGERAPEPRLANFVLGVLVVEDLISMLLLALLTALLAGSGLSASQFALSSLQLAGFLAALAAGGLLVVPRLLRWVMASGSREVILLAALGVCFAFALLAKRAGYSIALGAFLAGCVVAEAGHGRILEPLVRPVRDMFAAIFFVAVGMMIDPALVVEHLPLAGLLAAVIVGGKLLGVSVGGLLSGFGPSFRGALWLVPVGEYQFLIAELARQSGVRGGELHAIAAALCLATVLAAPLLVNRSESIAIAVEHRMPRRLVLLETLYSAWIEALKQRRNSSQRRPMSRLGLWIAADAAALLGLVITASLWRKELVDELEHVTHWGRTAADVALIALLSVACAPLGLGIVRAARRLALLVAEAALPATTPAQPDLAATPRRALASVVQGATLLAVGVPILALSAPFVPSLGAIGLALAAACVLLLALRRRVADLDGHFRAGTQVVLEALVRESSSGAAPSGPHALEQVNELLPGLGQLTAVRVEPGSSAVDRTLAQLDLHARTGASVVCVARGGRGWNAALADEALAAGDLVALTGTPDEIARASAELRRSAAG
jgi:CPA2 family monovalent cation:H+ antiporter-2